MPSIDDVAIEAEVSRSTVSRAFGHPASLNPTTLAHVLDVAGRLGYRPRTATAAARRRTGNIGVVVPGVSNPYFEPLIKAVQHEAGAGDSSVFVGDGGNDPALELQIARALIGHVDGLLLVSSRLEEADVVTLAGEVPLVVVNREIDGVSGVVLSSGEGMVQAVEHLAALGHRRIAFLTGPRRILASVTRLEALRETAKRLAIDVVELGPFQPSYDAGLHATDLVLSTECSAVIAYNDLTALGLMTRAAELGVTIGRDLSVIGFDGIWMGSTSSPPLTTVAAPVGAAGTAAIRDLLAVMGGRESETHRSFPSELIARSSTGPVPGGRPRRASARR